MYKKLLIVFSLFLAIQAAATAFAQTVTSRGYLISNQAEFSLRDLESQTFVPYQGVLNRGYGNEYLWLKLHVVPGDAHAASNSIEDWILRIRPTYLGEIALYDTQKITNPNSLLQPQRLAGQRYAMESNGYNSINPGFKLESSNQPRDIYLRLKTSTTRLIGADVLSESKAYEEDQKQLVLTSGFLSLLAFFTLWAVLQWLVVRERLLVLFVIKQTVVLAFGITNLGYMKMLIGEGGNWGLIDNFVKLNNFTYAGVTYFFEVAFLSYFVSDRRYSRYAYLPLAFWAIGLGMFFSGFEVIGLQMNMYLVLISPAIFFFLVFKTKSASNLSPGEQPPILSRNILASFYLFYLLAVYLVVLPNIGLVKAQEFIFALAVYASVISSALMATLLILRTRNLNRQKVVAEMESGLAHQNLEIEKGQRERQSQFISMLTHELKTPISVAKLSLDAMNVEGIERDRIQRALQNMNDVVERCRISDAIEGHHFQVKRSSFDLREAVFECLDLLPTPERVKVFEGNNVFIHSDLQLVSIIIANLIDNALKYSPNTSQVTVCVSQGMQKGRLGASLLVVNQIGSAGTPDPKRVFQKYYRSKAAEGQSGSGLGLYLTAGIADLLGGAVTHLVRDDRIEFELWLPN